MMQTQREEKKTNCCVHCGISDLSLANRRLRFHAAAVALAARLMQNVCVFLRKAQGYFLQQFVY